MSQYLLAIDQGTTSSRAILYDSHGQIVDQHQQTLTQYYPQSGWVEHDPMEIWQSTINVCRKLFAKKTVTAKDILALGITNQRETTIVWHKKTGKPIYNAIVWQDRRTSADCQTLIAAGKEKIINDKTGLLLDPYFSATKIAWLLDHISGARKLAEQGDLLFGTIDSFLLWHLTAGKMHATDATNASRTLLFNIHTQQWDKELLDIFNIPYGMLPQVLDCCADFGVTDANLFGASIPIAAIAGDQQAALIGQACFKSGDVKCTYGTGAFLLLNTGANIVKSQHRLLTTIAYRLRGKTTYAIEGSIFAAGTIIQWLRDQLHLITTAAESENLAASLPDNGGVYFVPAFTGLGAPYWKADVRGLIMGLTRDTKAAHIVRAGLEAVAYQTYDLIRAMVKDGAQLPKELKIDGGMAANNWLLQFLANILQITIERPVVLETTSLGVAYLAGLQKGLFSSVDEIAASRKIEKNFSPDASMEKGKIWYQGWQQAIELIVA